MNPTLLDDVHRFWFGDLGGPDDLAPAMAPMWFRQDDATDRTIAERFGAAIPEAAAAAWDLPALTRTQQIGLVILLDQFPRNIHRSSGEAFAHDAVVRGIAAALLERGLDRFHAVERMFLTLPFQHSEAVADQDRGVLLTAQLVAMAPAAALPGARLALDFATKHRDLIRRFGRFPHRNAVLGRPSTEEETKFLAEHGRGY